MLYKYFLYFITLHSFIKQKINITSGKESLITDSFNKKISEKIPWKILVLFSYSEKIKFSVHLLLHWIFIEEKALQKKKNVTSIPDYIECRLFHNSWNKDFSLLSMIYIRVIGLSLTQFLGKKVK